MAVALANAGVRLDRLSCGHHGRPAVSDICVELFPGSITVLLGPNGVGKSTLLKTLAGTLKPIAGTIEIDGKSIDAHSPRDLARLVAYVPQEEEPQYAFTVAEAVVMGRLPHADAVFDSQEDLSAAESAMRQAGCLGLSQRSVLELSGGELQRVLVARALAQDPRILLLDEPTSHLDVHHALDLVHMLRNLASEGVTVIAAIHDLNLAGRLGDTGVLLGGGVQKAYASVDELLRSPDLDATFGVQFKRVELDQGLFLVPLDGRG